MSQETIYQIKESFSTLSTGLSKDITEIASKLESDCQQKHANHADSINNSLKDVNDALLKLFHTHEKELALRESELAHETEKQKHRHELAMAKIKDRLKIIGIIVGAITTVATAIITLWK